MAKKRLQFTAGTASLAGPRERNEDFCGMVTPQGAELEAKGAQQDIAVFRNDADEVFALEDRCPHKGGPLSQGIVYGRTVACPLHNWNIQLADGRALEPDQGCAARFAVKVEDGEVFLQLV